MSYTSFGFLCLIVITVILFYLVPKKIQWVILLLSSLLFYAISGLDNLAFILLSIAVTYLAGLKIGNVHQLEKDFLSREGIGREEQKERREIFKKKRKRLLKAGLFYILGILILVKYLDFLLGNVSSLLGVFGMEPLEFSISFIMPLGISFYTFQIIAYLVDIYKGKVKPQKNIFKYALYVSFFPTVVQGPIARYGQLGDQLFSKKSFCDKNLVNGSILILWGFFKKLVIAERLNLFVNEIYGNYTEYSGIIFAIATAFYSIQIYADFSGCMDIAQGTAGLFDIQLAENFKQPYFSKTMPEFWRRWHITLGQWFKDYVFYPVSISKFSLNLNKKARKIMGNTGGRIVTSCFPILIVWFLTGIWHGASWKFAVWGLFHGGLIMLSLIFTPYNEKLSEKLSIPTKSIAFSIFCMLRTFALCSIGRIFFRGDSLGHALEIIKRMFQDPGLSFITGTQFFEHGLNKANMLVVFIAMGALLLVSILKEHFNVREKLMEQNFLFRWSVCYALFFSVLIFGIYGRGYEISNFIYERF